MGNPQKENGYTPIANELFEAIIRFRIAGEVRQVFDAILRKTYGYNKSEDAVANSQIVAMTGLNKQNVFRALKTLIAHKLVIKVDYSQKKGNVLKINKHYKDWLLFVVKTDYKKKSNQKRLPRSSKLITRVIKTDYETSSTLTDTKDKNISKDTLKTSKSPKELLQGEQWNHLIDSFAPVNPMYEGFYKMKTQRSALQDVANAIGYTKLLWLVTHLKQATSKPYAPRITTPMQLKSKLGELQTFWSQERQKQEKITNNSSPKVGKL